jgi:predicted RNase H-like HicB family nuclease
MILDLVVIKTNDGFTAEIPSIDGCESWAHSEEEVLRKILELASFYLKTRSEKFRIDKSRRQHNKTVYKLIFNKSVK